MKRPLPEIEIVDLKESRNVHFISDRLMEELQKTFAAKKQAILLMNRRGYSHYVLCTDCGYVPFCRDCSVSMTFSREAGNRMRCHYCDASVPAPNSCPECGGYSIKPVGYGTERIEEHISAKFPGIRITRLDRDTTSKKGALTEILNSFSRGETDLLIGTQIVAKGHDFPNVTTIGILLAETSLSFPDFRSPERTFQLLMQVAGRAGRGDEKGRVILQTFRPDNYAVRSAILSDYAMFFREETGFREAFSYPPFASLVLLRVQSGKEEEIKRVCCDIIDDARSLAKDGVRIMGPSPAPIRMIKGQKRWHILFKCPRDYAVLKRVVGKLYPYTNTRTGGCRIHIDVDPQRWL